MQKQQLSWGLWGVGTVLLLLSWFNFVPSAIGWAGFVIALIGSILSFTKR